jgi:lysophospholipase L1-like esterase
MTRHKFIFLVAGLLLLLGFAEIGLRVVFGLGHPIRYELDSACGYFTRPNQATRKLFARTITNSSGMRSPEFSAAKTPGTLRLLFLGDSITYGTILVDQDQIFAEQVRKHLSAKLHRPVEEINASANSWAISNEYGFLRTRGTYNSDYVLLVLNTGDLDQPFADISEVQVEQLAGGRTAITELLTTHWPARQKVFQSGAGAIVGNNPVAEQTNLQDLTSIAELSRAHGAEFLLVFVPFRRYIAKGAADSAPSRLKHWALTQGVDLLDVTPALSAYETNATTQRDGIHLNSFGNRLVAEVVEQFVADKFRKARR